MVRNIKSVAKINQRCNLRLIEELINIVTIPWVQKITIATLKNRLSLNFTLWNIESAANPIQKTIAAYGWVHLSFRKVLILGHLR